MKGLLVVAVAVTVGALASNAVGGFLEDKVGAYKGLSGGTKTAIGVGLTAAGSLLVMGLIGGRGS